MRFIETYTITEVYFYGEDIGFALRENYPSWSDGRKEIKSRILLIVLPPLYFRRMMFAKSGWLPAKRRKQRR
jgi:hypothetical protein